MGFFTKDKKDASRETAGLNNLPELPKLPEIKANQDTPKKILPSLPELPNAPASSKLQEIPITRSFSLSPSSIPEKRTIELPDGYKKSVKPFKSSLLPTPIAPIAPVTSTTLTNYPASNFSREPLFIKIDKFQDALKRFQEVKSKVAEIEESLREIRAIKEKEEQELKLWEEEIHSVKEKVDSIDSSLFDKI